MDEEMILDEFIPFEDDPVEDTEGVTRSLESTLREARDMTGSATLDLHSPLNYITDTSSYSSPGYDFNVYEEMVRMRQEIDELKKKIEEFEI